MEQHEEQERDSPDKGDAMRRGGRWGWWFLLITTVLAVPIFAMVIIAVAQFIIAV